MDSEHEVLTWPDFGRATRELAQLIADDGFLPDIIMCIARGGLLIGGALGYALDVKPVAEVNVELYTGIDARLPAPVMRPPTPRANDLSGLRVLIADDVTDTGTTLAFTEDYLRAHAAETRSAVLFEKSHATSRATYVWRRTDRWIDFPWSVLPPVRRSVTVR